MCLPPKEEEEEEKKKKTLWNSILALALDLIEVITFLSNDGGNVDFWGSTGSLIWRPGRFEMW
jgi:hypothetical protein